MQLDARKSLVIGLGSTGAKVCNQILDRMMWSYDSPTAVPWMRFLVLDTAPIEATQLVSKHAECHHLMVSPPEYANLLDNAEPFRPLMNFGDWDIRSATQGADSIIDGASNVRILGRLSLLWPRNYTAVRRAITEHLKSLAELTEGRASTAFTKGWGEDATVVFGEETHVYVIGSLCGGTGSGAFLDLGYILQTLEGYRPQRTGIFFLPSAAHDTPQHKANTYSALIELNHFSTDSTQYKQQLPHRRGTVTMIPPGTSPYRYCYLVQSRSASDKAYCQLLTSTADYIFNDAVGSSSIIRDSDRSNVSSLFNQTDYEGATQKFFSLGLSTIEFPYAKVMKACTVRLTRQGFQELKSGTAPAGQVPLTGTALETLLGKVPLVDREAIQNELLSRGGVPLTTTISTVIINSDNGIKQGDLAMVTLQEQLNAAFGASTSNAHAQLPINIVALTLEENQVGSQEKFLKQIRAVMVELLDNSSPNYGLPQLASFLQNLKQKIQLQKQELTNIIAGNDIRNAEQQLTAHSAAVTKCRNSCWKRRSLDGHIGTFRASCDTLYQARLDAVSAPAIEEVYDAVLRVVEKALSRLTNQTRGIDFEVEGILSELSTVYQNTNVAGSADEKGWERHVNGVSLFDVDRDDPTQPGKKIPGTVEREYWASLRDYKAENKLAGDERAVEKQCARATVESYINIIVDALLLDPDRIGIYDVDPNARDRVVMGEEVLALAKSARRYFKRLKTRTVVERLMAEHHHDLPQNLQHAKTQSKMFLDWIDGHPRYHPDDRKHYGYILFDTSSPQAENFRSSLVDNQINDGDITIANFSNPHQVLMLNEQGAFSLATVEQLAEENRQDGWRPDYISPPGQVPTHTRGDIEKEEWISWLKTDEGLRQNMRAKFFVGIALEVIVFENAQQYRFKYVPVMAADAGYILLPNDVGEAIAKIKKKNLMGQLNLQISGMVEEMGPRAVVRRITDYIKAYKRREVAVLRELMAQGRAVFTEEDLAAPEGDDPFAVSLLIEGGETLTTQSIEATLVEYLFQDQVLEMTYTELNPNPVFANYRRPDGNGVQAYFCPHCDAKLGYHTRSLFVWQNVNGARRELCKCSQCERPLN